MGRISSILQVRPAKYVHHHHHHVACQELDVAVPTSLLRAANVQTVYRHPIYTKTHVNDYFYFIRLHKFTFHAHTTDMYGTYRIHTSLMTSKILQVSISQG